MTALSTAVSDKRGQKTGHFLPLTEMIFSERQHRHKKQQDLNCSSTEIFLCSNSGSPAIPAIYALLSATNISPMSLTQGLGSLI